MADPRRSPWYPLFVHLRLPYQLVLLSPLFLWGFLLGGQVPSLRAGLGFVVFHVFLYGGITAYNSYFDRDEGPVGGLRVPPPVTEPLLAFSLVVQTLGLVLALVVGVAFTILYLLVMLLSVAYSHPRWRWKARPILSLFVVAFGQGAIGFLGGWLCGHSPPLPWWGSPIGMLGMAAATLMTVGLYPLTQLYQIKEDAERGDRTFAVAYGAKGSFGFALVCLTLAGACMVLLVSRLWGGWDAILIGAAFLTVQGIIVRWWRRFENEVYANFRFLHRLQVGLSLAMLGYMGFACCSANGPIPPVPRAPPSGAPRLALPRRCPALLPPVLPASPLPPVLPASPLPPVLPASPCPAGRGRHAQRGG